MSDMIYIQDDFGNQIPLLDDYGNMSVHVIMLYTEDKLTEADRKTVSDFAATDEMTKDALDGFALTSNPSKTRHILGELNSNIQKSTGASAVGKLPRQQSGFDYRKLAAAVAVLIVIGGATFFGSQYFGKDELADNGSVKTMKYEPPKRETVRELVMDSVVEEELLDNNNVVEAELSSSADEPTIIEEPKRELQKQAEVQAPQKDEVVEKLKSKTDDSKDIATSEIIANQQATDEDLIVLADVEEVEEEIADADQLAESSPVYTEQKAAGAAELDQERLKEEAEAANERADMVIAAFQDKARSSKKKQEEQGNQMEAERQALSDQSGAAKFPGGDIALYKFIDRKKIYTDAMKALNLNGAVTVSFDIEPDGRVSNAKIKSGENGLMNEDALRVVRSMPSWKPAKDSNGNAIRSSKTVVVKYGE